MTRLRALTSSYRGRLALGYALVVALLAGAWAWSLYGPLDASIIEQQREHLRGVAQAGALALQRTGVSPQATASAVVRGTGLRATVVRADGTVVADTSESPSRMENHAGRPEVQAALAGRVGYATRRSATLGTEQLYVAVRADIDGARGVFRVSEPLARIDELAGNARGTGLALLAAAILAAAWVGYRLTRSATEPVLRLKSAAEAMAAGRLDVAVPPVEGELAGLADALATLGEEIRSRIAQLETGRDELRTALDGLSSAVFLVEDGVIAIANIAASRMFRAPAGGWVGARPEDGGLPASLASDVTLALAGEAPSQVEVGPDPECRYYRVNAVPLVNADGTRGAILAIADITEVRRLDQVRRDFVANASHELKTPVAAIQLLSESVETAAKDGEVDTALAFAGQIRGEADRLRRLVVDLLDLSRLESAPQPGTLTDVREAVANSLAAHHAAATAAGLALTVDDAAVAGQDVYVAAEPADVAVALDNLLANAVAYTETGGVTVGIGADDAAVAITVTDTGIGIPSEHLPRIFERFYRVDGARSRASGGTGLGLALVKHVTERSGGSVEVSSAVGRGTTMTLRLPRAR